MPEGKYRPKVELGNADRTIVLPNPIRVDVTRARGQGGVDPSACDLARRRRPERRRSRPLPLERAGTRDVARGRCAAGDESRRASLPARSSGSRSALCRAPTTSRSRHRTLPGTSPAPAAGGLSRCATSSCEPLRRQPLAAACAIHADTDAKSVRWTSAEGLERRRVGRRRAHGLASARPRKPGRYLLVARRPARHQARTTLVVAQDVSAAPLLVLGVRRSGTTLLRVMLDRHSALAIPDESYFIPQLADRHRGVDRRRRVRRRPAPAADAARLGRRVDGGRARLRPGMTARARRSPPSTRRTPPPRQGAAGATRRRCTCSTCRLLERLFPDARYVHLIRDGRDAARVLPLDARGDRHAHVGAPARRAGDFACQWRSEVEAARALGRARRRRATSRCATRRSWPTPSASCGGSASFAGLAFEPAMLEYAGEVDVSAKPHQQSLHAGRRRPALRDWRTELAAADAARVRGRSPATCSPSSATSAERRSGRSGRARRRTWYRAQVGRVERGRRRRAAARPPGGGGTRRSLDLAAGCSARGRRRGSRSARSSSGGRSRSPASTCPCRSARRSCRRVPRRRTSSARGSRRRRACRRRPPGRGSGRRRSAARAPVPSAAL